MPILAAAPTDEPPFAVDARVLEEDRWLVLSAPPIISERALEHPIRIHTAVAEATRQPLGAVVVQTGRLLAVVHDLDRDPTTTLGDVEAALAAVMKVCEVRSLRRLAMPLLGAVHGKLSRPLVLAAIARAVASTKAVEALWLVTDDAEDLETLRASWPR